MKKIIFNPDTKSFSKFEDKSFAGPDPNWRSYKVDKFYTILFIGRKDERRDWEPMSYSKVPESKLDQVKDEIKSKFQAQFINTFIDDFTQKKVWDDLRYKSNRLND